MTTTISTRNDKSQLEIFLSEMSLPIRHLVKFGMAKKQPDEPPEIFLGEWLALYEIGPSEAAEIAGCTQSYISNISGGRRPNVKALYLFKLSERMRITVNHFYRKAPTLAQLALLDDIPPAARREIIERRRRKA